MAGASPRAGDKVFFKKKGIWHEGWKIACVMTNKYGVVNRIMVGNNQKRLSLSLTKDIVFMQPPHKEIKDHAYIVKKYPNLRIVRSKFNEMYYMLVCSKCHTIINVTQTYTENSDITLWYRGVSTSKPCIQDGSEEITCDCEGVKYDIEFEPY